MKVTESTNPDSTCESNVVFHNTPCVYYYDYAGKWRLPCSDTLIGTKTKPNWFHRLMMRLILGWKWEGV